MPSQASNNRAITLAVAKGRPLKDVLPILTQAGLSPRADPSTTRRLVLETEDEHVSMMIVRSSDVPTYVRFGVADMGIVGKDVIMETGLDLYELLDLGVSRCRLVVAEAANKGQGRSRRMRVATKYPTIAKGHYAERGIQAEVIHLYGSMELAPISGLADQIVDLVDTGSTLSANKLVELETIAHVSARLVVNPAAYKIKRHAIDGMIGRIQAHVNGSDPVSLDR